MTVYIIKLRGISGSSEDIIDICTNKKQASKTIWAMLKKTDSLIFRDNSLFNMLPKYKPYYDNLADFLNRLSSGQFLEMDLYRFIDEHEKIHVSTVVLQKWKLNSKK